VQDPVVTCLQLATISEDRATAVIGKLSAAMLAKLNVGLDMRAL
jgi:hypothetical protein